MIETAEKIAEALEWNFHNHEEYILFSKHTSKGQEINLEIDKEEANCLACIAREAKQRYESFDVSEETYLWLDNSGHGKNGAPYDMKDVYEDMEEAKEEFGKLADLLLSVADFLKRNEEIGNKILKIENIAMKENMWSADINFALSLNGLEKNVETSAFERIIKRGEEDGK